MISASPFEHESLLVDNDSKLSLAEKREAREAYHRDKQKEMGTRSFLAPTSGFYPDDTLNEMTSNLARNRPSETTVKSSLVNLLTKNRADSKKPVANIRPFSIRNSSTSTATQVLPL